MGRARGYLYFPMKEQVSIHIEVSEKYQTYSFANSEITLIMPDILALEGMSISTD